jgi:mannitol-1-phosphate/altronate dehydrogenase
VHIGVGGFHRAHQAVYFDDLAARGVTDWGVVGVAVRSHELADALAAQNNLFTVVERDGDDASARVVGSLLEFLVLADDPAAVQQRLADPQTRLVTLTITGDGYRADEETVRKGESLFATVAQALDDRRRADGPPFTILSCDNMPDAGEAARAAVLAHAAAVDPELVAWVEQNVCFPASMVDRITPGASDEDREWVEDEFAVADLAPVVTEGFAQWVVEDKFCNGRPPLDQVGVQFVDDVAPYKLIKSRMLNGTHCALGYVGYLAGHRSTDAAMADPVVAGYIDHLLGDEIAPLMPQDVAGMDPEQYRATLIERFGNAAIADPLSRLCRRGTTKMGDYLLPSLAEARSQGRPHQLLLLATAAWLRYVRGTDLDGEPIEVVDPREDLIAEANEQSLDDGVRLLVERLDAFEQLRADDGFLDELLQLVHALDERGVCAVVGDLIEGSATS